MPDPYNPHRLVDIDEPYSPSPYHPRAIGLQGEMLDAMLKAAFTEGVLVGAEEARETEQLAHARVHDHGYDAGVAMMRARLEEADRRASSSFQMLRQTIAESQMSKSKKDWLLDTHLTTIEQIIGAILRETSAT